MEESHKIPPHHSHLSSSHQHEKLRPAKGESKKQPWGLPAWEQLPLLAFSAARGPAAALPSHSFPSASSAFFSSSWGRVLFPETRHSKEEPSHHHISKAVPPFLLMKWGKKLPETVLVHLFSFALSLLFSSPSLWTASCYLAWADSHEDKLSRAHPACMEPEAGIKHTLVQQCWNLFILKCIGYSNLHKNKTDYCSTLRYTKLC